MMWGYGNMFDLGFGGWLMMIIFWGAIIAFVVWAINGFRETSRGGSRDALDILRERYAKGEIDKKEFESRKKDLVG